MPGTVLRKALIYCSDDKGLPMALFSAAQAARLAPERDFDILICSIEPLTIPAQFTGLGITHRQIEFTDELAKLGVKQGGRVPATAFLRLWLAQIFAASYDRILYLDYDTYILSDRLSDLMAANLGPHPIAAVRDTEQWRHPNRAVHDFDVRKMPGRKYLNSGVLLIDTARYAACNALERMLATHSAMGPLMHADQSLINLTLGHEWAELSPVWNWQWVANTAFKHPPADPHILHFCGDKKPFRTDGQTGFPRYLVNEYILFLRQHFPDRGFDPLAPAAFRKPYFKALAETLEHAWTLRAVNRYMKRFRHDLDVIT